MRFASFRFRNCNYVIDMIESYLHIVFVFYLELKRVLIYLPIYTPAPSNSFDLQRKTVRCVLVLEEFCVPRDG